MGKREADVSDLSEIDRENITALTIRFIRRIRFPYSFRVPKLLALLLPSLCLRSKFVTNPLQVRSYKSGVNGLMTKDLQKQRTGILRQTIS